MGEKNILTKQYMRNPDVFADFFNGFIYNGKEVINPESLHEIDVTGIALLEPAGGGKKKPVERVRDIMKNVTIMKGDSAYFVLLGIENQTDVHYAMPVRNMLYNALSYSEQVEAIAAENRKSRKCVAGDFLSGYTKDDRLVPVITVTIYWGSEQWDGPTTLKEMLMETDEEALSFIDDVNCNLFSIIDARELPEYRTELKQVFECLNTRNDFGEMQRVLTSDAAFTNISRDAANLMKTFASIKLPKKNKKGGYDMCKAIADMIEENQRLGRAEGRAELLVEQVKDGVITIEYASKNLGITKEAFEKLMKNKEKQQ